MEKDNHTNGIEQFFDKSDIIVSKTDLKGRITYVNQVFIDISGYTEEELLGAPHSILRHSKMPRCVFKLLWDTIQNKQEIFAYVMNKCKNSDYYWVLAHVTPSINDSGQVDGYHSNRRVPDPEIVKTVISPLYQSLLGEEQRHKNAKEGMNKGFEMLVNILNEKGIAYDEFVFSLNR